MLDLFIIGGVALLVILAIVHGRHRDTTEQIQSDVPDPTRTWIHWARILIAIGYAIPILWFFLFPTFASLMGLGHNMGGGLMFVGTLMLAGCIAAPFMGWGVGSGVRALVADPTLRTAGNSIVLMLGIFGTIVAAIPVLYLGGDLILMVFRFFGFPG